MAKSRKIETIDLYVNAQIESKQEPGVYFRVGVAQAKYGPTGRHLFYPIYNTSGALVLNGCLSDVRARYRKRLEA